MSRRRFQGDPQETLRRADPLDRHHAPQDTTGVHARALFQEVVSMDTMEHKASASAPRGRTGRRLALAGGALAVAAAVAVGAVAFLGEDAPEPVVGGVPVGSDAMAICLAFDEATLAQQEFAFDGTVKSIDVAEGTEDGLEATEVLVTFEVHRWFKGGEGAEATFRGDGLVGETSLALTGPGLEVGQRYLISGSEIWVWGCGYSLTYDSVLADRWAEIFGG